MGSTDDGTALHSPPAQSVVVALLPEVSAGPDAAGVGFCDEDDEESAEPDEEPDEESDEPLDDEDSDEDDSVEEEPGDPEELADRLSLR